MTPQIELDDGRPGPPLRSPVRVRKVHPTRPLRALADIDWERRGPDALLLFLAEEPAIGDRFAYDGVTWEVVAYRDGWVARLVCTPRRSAASPTTA